ncbi:DUF3089 domain-containing protein [Phenylobacterium montanum]|uniref:DUF3089 domain-containing protein n=1 Tax=Phenylobacterium montanum TaxID=2823693 RepID=A0A975G0N1_9CAUL|nr:DUF3089 domain-containing protein [Caulobacter sp. S6]QUD88940.1 DUF3089 domain-containing protein [Caulobacter sp. S6]
MRKLELSGRDWFLAVIVILLGLVLAAAIRWRHDILQTTLDPKRPFQIYQPPPAPDYGRRGAWALLPPKADQPNSGDPPADVFFIHPTTFDGGKDWNGPIDQPQANRVLERVMLPNYAGPFQRVGRLFAPRYRQASIYTELTLRDDAREARAFAYDDIRRAFDFYLGRFNQGRPILLVGVEQGGTLAERLLREETDAHPSLRQQLVAVYLIDAVALSSDYYGASAPLPACLDRHEAHCVVGWTQSFDFDLKDIRNTYDRSMVWEGDHLVNVGGRPILCVNPVLGAASTQKASARSNLGAANATDMEWGLRPAILGRQVSAQCVNGVLRVSRPASPSLKTPGGWLDQLKEPGYNLFYADLEADARARLAQALAAPAPQ